MGSLLPAAIGEATAWSRRFARTTPGVLGALGVVLALLALVAGLLSANQLGGKITRHDTVLTHTEPLANAAQRLYVALSTADAAAATAFLSGGVETAEVRTRYENALTDAAAALAEATAGASDIGTREILALISAELPSYTGYVEAARANNRQGLLVGSAYLRQASALMQDSILKNAEALEQERLGQLHSAQTAITAPPWLTLATLLALLAGCGYGSWILLRRTNRRVNSGIAAAAALTVLTISWIGTATAAAATAMDTAATDRFQALAQTRILAQQARTEETLQLVTRGNLDESENRFTAAAQGVRDRIDTLFTPDSTAAAAFSRWQDGHRREIAAYRGNDYRGAVNQSIGATGTGSAAEFDALDTALDAELQQTRRQVRDGVNDAGHALTLSPFGTLVFMLAAAAAVVTGLWPRMQEFL